MPPDTTLRETPVRAVTIALLGGLALLGSCRDGRDSVTAPPLGQPTFPPTPPAQLAQITGRIAFVSTRDGSPHIYVADSASVTRLTPGERPSWSLDGRRIAFHRCSGLPVCRGPLEIHVIDADGSNERVLGPGANPAWSPDGFRIAFEWPGGIGSAGLNESKVRSHVSGRAFDPDWSPDGRRLVFNKFTSTEGDATSALGSRMRIFVVTIDSGAVRQLVPEAVAPALPNYWDYQAAWSRVK